MRRVNARRDRQDRLECCVGIGSSGYPDPCSRKPRPGNVESRGPVAAAVTSRAAVHLAPRREGSSHQRREVLTDVLTDTRSREVARSP